MQSDGANKALAPAMHCHAMDGPPKISPPDHQWQVFVTMDGSS